MTMKEIEKLNQKIGYLDALSDVNDNLSVLLPTLTTEQIEQITNILDSLINECTSSN